MRLRLFVLIGLLLICPPAHLTFAQAIPPVDSFLCYNGPRSKDTSTFTPVLRVPLPDRFETLSFDAKPPKLVCGPASNNGGTIIDANTHLQSYRMARPKNAPELARQTNFHLQNRFGELFVDTRKAKFLLVPTALDLQTQPPAPDPAAHDADRYKCFDIAVTKCTPAFPAGQQVTLTDQFPAPGIFEVTKPRHRCDLPLVVNGRDAV